MYFLMLFKLYIMNLKSLLPAFTITLCCCVFSLRNYAQKQSLAGVNISTDVYPELRPRVGITFEKQFRKHSGAETGLYYRTQRLVGFVNYTDSLGSNSYSFAISSKYLSVPLLYKYYSDFLNFSAGPTLDFYVGWKQKNNASGLKIQSHTVNPKITIGYQAKVSKIFNLNRRFIVEPEIRFGSYQILSEANIGVGMGGKYRL